MMSVSGYRVRLLNYSDCRIRFDDPVEFALVLKTWRHSHSTSAVCTDCKRILEFEIFKDDKHQVDNERNFQICCNRFYFKPTTCYLPESIAVKTPGYSFVLPCLQRAVDKRKIDTDQEFLIVPDPVYWQVPFTLVLDKIVKFVTGSPMTKKTDYVLPASKTPQLFKQMLEAPLNHGSLGRRSGGKNTFFRQFAFGKRCRLSARAMIVPDTQLRPNEISVPAWMAERFDLEGQWLILNRMPSLQPENFVALRVTKLWEHQCFGIPLEILEQINGDFDGDECNLYFLRNPIAQAECEWLLNSERNIQGSTLDLKLHPSREMQIVYHLLYDSSKLDFLGSYKRPSLHETFRIVADMEGSKAAFQCIDEMRRLSLDVLQNERVFGASIREMRDLVKLADDCRDFESFAEKFERSAKRGPLWHTVFSRAKGNPFIVYLMVGSIGPSGQSSLWKGLAAEEAIPHARASADGFQKANNVSGPGYDYAKSVNCQQGVHCDYRGRLVDGNSNLVIERDALKAVSAEKLMSRESFRELVRKCMKRKTEEIDNKKNRRHCSPSSR